ncbi:MAG: hypothetical protein QCH99_07775 [Candidatus Bathyarchaeota archaeon]|nr:hypothetical protein [Candidatus Bathyarchaeum tardum]
MKTSEHITVTKQNIVIMGKNCVYGENQEEDTFSLSPYSYSGNC